MSYCANESARFFFKHKRDRWAALCFESGLLYDGRPAPLFWKPQLHRTLLWSRSHQSERSSQYMGILNQVNRVSRANLLYLRSLNCCFTPAFCTVVRVFEQKIEGYFCCKSRYLFNFFFFFFYIWKWRNNIKLQQKKITLLL